MKATLPSFSHHYKMPWGSNIVFGRKGQNILWWLKIENLALPYANLLCGAELVWIQLKATSSSMLFGFGVYYVISSRWWNSMNAWMECVWMKGIWCPWDAKDGWFISPLPSACFLLFGNQAATGLKTSSHIAVGSSLCCILLYSTNPITISAIRNPLKFIEVRGV